MNSDDCQSALAELQRESRSREAVRLTKVTISCGFLQGQDFQKFLVPLGAHLQGVKQLGFLEEGTSPLLGLKTADNQ